MLVSCLVLLIGDLRKGISSKYRRARTQRQKRVQMGVYEAANRRLQPLTAETNSVPRSGPLKSQVNG